MIDLKAFRLYTFNEPIGSFLFCQTPGLVPILGYDFVLYKSQQQQEPHQNLLKDLEMYVWQGVSYSEGWSDKLWKEY